MLSPAMKGTANSMHIQTSVPSYHESESPTYLVAKETAQAFNKVLYNDFPSSLKSILTLDLPQFSKAGDEISKDITKVIYNLTHGKERAKEFENQIHQARERARKRRGWRR